VLTLLIVTLFPVGQLRMRYLVAMLVCYLLAKIVEHYDAQIYQVLGGVISGHSLKHAVAAMAVGGFVLSLPPAISPRAAGADSAAQSAGHSGFRR
jgi:hypothetical protein